jgi:hypothetical protein
MSKEIGLNETIKDQAISRKGSEKEMEENVVKIELVDKINLDVLFLKSFVDVVCVIDQDETMLTLAHLHMQQQRKLTKCKR